jgi:hypothetical protein
MEFMPYVAKTKVLTGFADDENKIAK